MTPGYVIARENFKEAGKHVSAETDPVMFNLLYGLQSLTNQIEADFASLLTDPRSSGAAPSKANKRKAPSKKRPVKKAGKRTVRRLR